MRAISVIIAVLALLFGGYKGYQSYTFRQNLAAAGYTGAKADGPLGYVTNKAAASQFHGCSLHFGNAPKGTKPRTINGHAVPAFVVSVLVGGKWVPQSVTTPTPAELGKLLAARKVRCKL